jgi:multiple sugar transport system substrate-binding protein
MGSKDKAAMKKWVLGLAAGMLLVPLAACGSNGGAGNENGDEVKGKALEEDNTPAKIVFYSTSGWSQEAFNERFGDAMRKKFPHYTIEYIATGKGTTFPEMMAAGTEIDVVWHDVNTTIPQLLEYGLQYDMTELIKKQGLNMTNLESTSIDVVKQMSGGKMYALPLVINTAAFYYNKDLFDKFAVAYPKDGMTWDQVADLAKRMRRTDSGIDYYGIVSGTQPQFNLTSMAVPFIDPKTNKPTILTDDRWKTLYQQLIALRKTMDNKNLGEDHFVKDKNIAMLDYLANTFLNKDMTTMNWDLVTYPTFKELPDKGPQTLPTLFGITSTSKNKDAAMKVLAYMLSEEPQLGLSERAIIPVLQTDKTLKAFATKSKYEGKNFQAILKLKFTPVAPKSAIENKARTAFAKPVVQLVDEKLDLNTAFRQVDEEMNKIIAEEMARLAK